MDQHGPEESHVQQRNWWSGVAAVCMAAAVSAQAQAQTTTGSDAPSVRVGATLFTDATYTAAPETTDADGNAVHASAFNVSRTYLNITGTLSPRISFRITPDIVRESATGASLSGSLAYRVKYAFAQVNLEPWLGRGGWARVGVQQTPWLDFQEGLYRYRFQGQMFAEREGYLTSSDAGISVHTQAGGDRFESHLGVYNGEGYTRAEVNDQKALQWRGSLRPWTTGDARLRGLRVHVVADVDHYVRHAERRRLLGSVTYEHRRVNAGVEWLATADQTRTSATTVHGHGYSLWATPRLARGWELLLRRDHMVPDSAFDLQTRTRTVLGGAYWFPLKGGVSTALMLDYDGQTFTTSSTPAQRRVAVHALVAF